MSNLFGLVVFMMLQPVLFMGSAEDIADNFQISYNESASHQTWHNLLQKYVDQEGNVNYKGFKEDEPALDEYLDFLADSAPGSSSTKEEKLVFYINLYNAATVKLILENYPVRSIKDIKSPWDKKWVKVGDEILSLGAIEHKILRKLNEPRIHFAINCASYSCPKLSNQAYTISNLEGQLEMASKDFVNDSKRNKIGAREAQISEIFKWFKSDFTVNGSLKAYINQYADEPIGPDTKLKYINYDWSLNETK